MAGAITVLWLVDECDLPVRRDDRFRHVVGDPDFPAATIVSQLSEGPVLVVVRSDVEAEQAIEYGADEVILAADAAGAAFEKAVERTNSRARARLNRDLFLIDCVRKDDTSALSVFAAALGEEIAEPLKRAVADGGRLARRVDGDEDSAEQARSLSRKLEHVAKIVGNLRQLVDAQGTDEVVDLSAVTRDVAQALRPAVTRVAELEMEVVSQHVQVGMPRWQVAMTVASLLANSIESVSACGGQGHRICVRVLVHDGLALLEVADDGEGMDEEVRAYASDPFFTTSGKGQLGLGLTLVSARVRRAGGTLMIESDQGVGTTVRVFLPLVGETVAPRRSN